MVSLKMVFKLMILVLLLHQTLEPLLTLRLLIHLHQAAHLDHPATPLPPVETNQAQSQLPAPLLKLDPDQFIFNLPSLSPPSLPSLFLQCDI